MFGTLIRGGKPQLMPVNGEATITSTATTGNSVPKNSLNTSFQVIAGAAATVVIEVTNDEDTHKGTNSNWIILATVTIYSVGTDGFTTNAPWGWVRARVTSATGTVKVLMGV